MAKKLTFYWRFRWSYGDSDIRNINSFMDL